MVSFTHFRKIIQQIQVVRAPRHRLSTFGSTSIQYTLVTDVGGLTDRARLRMGTVTAEKPVLLTPDIFKERFSGFGDEGMKYASYLTNQYGAALRGLEYQFRNDPESSHVELLAPDTLMDKLSKEFDASSNTRQTLIRGRDKHWQLAVMKFIVEETLTSFQANVQELNERGFFDGDDRVVKQRQRELQNLIGKARHDKTLIPIIGRKLKEYNLFDHFQDEFFQLVKS